MEPLLARDVWRCAGVMPGALCAMTFGGTLMLLSFANSWDFPDTVSEPCKVIMGHKRVSLLCTRVTPKMLL